MTVIVNTRETRYQKHTDICTYEMFGDDAVLNAIKEPVEFILKQDKIFNNDCLEIYKKTLTKLKKRSNEIDERLQEIKQEDRFYWAKKEERKEYSQLKDDKKQTMKDIIFLDTHIQELKEDMSKIMFSSNNTVSFFENMGFKATSRIVEDAENCICSTFEYPKDHNSLIKNINKEYQTVASEYANKFRKFLRGDRKYEAYIDTNTLDKLVSENNDRINNPITLEKDENEMNK